MAAALGGCALLIGAMWLALGSSRTADRHPRAPVTARASAKAVDSLPADAPPLAQREAGARPSAAGGSTVSRVGSRYREHDLHLLGDVARVRGSKAGLGELLALRDRGASRDEFERHIANELEGMLVEVAARRWLARELGEPPTRARVGRGGGRSSLGPLLRR